MVYGVRINRSLDVEAKAVFLIKAIISVSYKMVTVEPRMVNKF